MHDLSTRASHHRRRACALLAASLAAVLFIEQPQAASPLASDEGTSSIDRKAAPAQEIRIEFVKPGREGLELSARLTEDGETIARPIAWKVKNVDGETIFSGQAPVADMVAEPGDYVVELSYGAVHLAQSVALLAEQRLGVSFVLNVGGIRVLPRIESLGLPLARTRTEVYSASGLSAGKLVAISSQPGEILRVTAGYYRIETRFDPGNTVASTEVRVKPGIMSAVEIDHKAGLAHLRLAKASDDSVSWIVTPNKGEALHIDANAADVVLSPGDYTAEAKTRDSQYTVQFSIAAGQSQNVILGQ